jgi:hypothetical protein
MRSKHALETGPSETHPPPLTAEQFKASAAFRKFKGIMRKLLKVSKPVLDEMVKKSKERSPRAGNPNAPGRKPTSRPKTS